MPTQGLTRALAAGWRTWREADASRKGGRHLRRGCRARRPWSSLCDRGDGDRPFLRMNSNSYLGMALRSEVIEAEEQAAALCGTGPGAVRFISGTWSNHVALEQRLARFTADPPRSCSPRPMQP